MTFDFRARAAKRELIEAEKQRKEREKDQKRWDRAASLEAAFLDYVQNDLFKNAVTSIRNGTVLTFREGSKILEVVIVEPSTFRVRNGLGPELSTEPWNNEGAVVAGDDDLIDILDSWAREK